MQENYAKKLVEVLLQNGIVDQVVLRAIATIPRERFVDEALAHQAYDNTALPIGAGQTISQPYIVAKMTELLCLSASSRVLEIGTGSGYQTAVLACIAQHVFSIERIKQLQWQAKRRLKQLDLHNISTRHADGWHGWITHAPFDAIIVTAAPAEVPTKLLQQLKDGGKMVLPVGKRTQYLQCIKRQGEEFLYSKIEAVRFVPMIKGELS